MKKLKLLDTFAGIGGFSYAAEKLVGGFETVQFIEIDPYCQQVLNKNFPNIPIHDDITTYRAEPHSADIITGGFPCQDLSQAGRRKGITETSRSGLWFQLIRTIRMVRPKYFILENVSAILANGMDIVLRDIFEAGYDAEWCCIPSSFVGACHQRDRWWLIGYPSNSNSMQRLNVLRQESEQRQKTQQGTSDRNNRSRDVADSDNDGQQGRKFETRNKNVTGQNSQGEWSANPKNIKRQSDDGSDNTKSRIDGDISRSSNGGKAKFTDTRTICELSKGADNNKRISRQDNNQENNDRTLVSQGQKRFQLPINRKLGTDKTSLENNSIRQGNDDSTEQRMDNKKSNVTNSKSQFSNVTKLEHPINKKSSTSESRNSSVTTSNSESKRTWKDESRLWGQSQGGDLQTNRNSNEKISNASNTESIGCGGGSGEECSVQERDFLQGKQRGSEMGSKTERCSINSSNPDSNGLQGKVGSRVYRPTWKTQNIRRLNPNWRQYISQPTIRRGDDGLSNKLDASQRVQRLKQLGNSIVPQVAAIPLQRVIQLEREQQ